MARTLIRVRVTTVTEYAKVFDLFEAAAIDAAEEEDVFLDPGWEETMVKGWTEVSDSEALEVDEDDEEQEQ